MKNKIKKIIIIWCIILIIFNNNFSYGVTVEEAGEALASYSYNFYKLGEKGEGAALTRYRVNDVDLDNSGQSGRAMAYEGKKKEGYYQMDCVGWVSFAIHNCLKIGEDKFSFFVTPQRGADNYPNYFEPVTGDYKPGDILTNTSPHVYIYIGEINGKGTIVHCTGWGGKGGPENQQSEGWGVECCYLDHYESSSPKTTGHFRIKKETAENIDKSQINTEGDLLKGTSVSNNSNNVKDLNMSDFYYNGIPDGKYSVTKSFIEVLVDSFDQIFDFIVGALTMVVRMVFVGCTALIELLVNYTLESITGESDLENIPVSSTEVDSGEGITLEKIIFNDIGIFDVNFFNFNDQDPEVMQKIDK